FVPPGEDDDFDAPDPPRGCVSPHDDSDTTSARELDGLSVASISVTCHADGWVVGEHALDPRGHLLCAVSDGYLPGVFGIADAYAAAVVNGDPTCPARRVE